VRDQDDATAYGLSVPDLGLAVTRAVAALIERQRGDGHWVFELEADATIPAEYILLRHYLGDVDADLDRRLARYLRRRQNAEGGWSLFHGGASDVSCSVKAYYALKAAGDPPDAPHMLRARAIIRRLGGAERCNVFTRILLAQFGQVPWHAVPAMPVQIINLPRWSPFHLSRVSYWSRTVIVPLLVIMAVRKAARNPHGVAVRELFNEPPETRTDWNRGTADNRWAAFFASLDAAVRRLEPLMPGNGRQRALDTAEAWVCERLNGEDGLGAIYPAMANAVMMFDALGHPPDHPPYRQARRALDRLVTEGREGETYVQPCFSPVWDTGLTCHALLEAGPATASAVRKALDWLERRQVVDRAGDWSVKRPGAPPGGWPFQYNNPHYPDVDDTAVVLMAMHRADPARYAGALRRGLAWIEGLQSRNGGWGAFDADNTDHYLNHIPFADHGALLDPPTSDVTARCVGMLAQIVGKGPRIEAGLDFLLREQEDDGAWFGRWGTNYVYGTWSVLSALQAAGVARDGRAMRRAVAWLCARQHEDGGWGESGLTYWATCRDVDCSPSTASQTAWALLGLMAAGEVTHPAVARGVAYLCATQTAEGLWEEDHYTAVGFPRVFYLRYHGYPAFFPLLALARYHNLMCSNTASVPWGV